MQLTGADRYNLEKVNQLEKYVDEQVSTSTYNLDANLTVLRLYQISPAANNNKVVANILLKALMQLPKPDFQLCVYQLSEKAQREEPVATVMMLAQHLEACRFGDFWMLATSCKDLLNGVPGFHEAVRAYIVHLVSLTFHRVPRKLLADCLKLDGQSLETLLEQKQKGGWAVVDSPQGEVVVLPKSTSSQQASSRTRDLIRFDQVATLIKTA